jgi:hypothetical protein
MKHHKVIVSGHCKNFSKRLKFTNLLMELQNTIMNVNY